MEHATDKIHVIFLVDDWEVESQSGVPLAHANDKSEAINAAKKLAEQRGIKTVILHHGDGVTEEIAAKPIEKPGTPAS
jgi:nucleotide-binding universal stress UspA family protein